MAVSPTATSTPRYLPAVSFCRIQGDQVHFVEDRPHATIRGDSGQLLSDRPYFRHGLTCTRVFTRSQGALVVAAQRPLRRRRGISSAAPPLLAGVSIAIERGSQLIGGHWRTRRWLEAPDRPTADMQREALFDAACSCRLLERVVAHLAPSRVGQHVFKDSVRQ